MIEHLAVDSNVVIDVIRKRGRIIPPLEDTQDIVLPLPVLGELLSGAYSARRFSENLDALQNVIKTWIVLNPNVDTAHAYGRIRASLREMPRTTQSRINDLWIAALCIQHNLPLLTNDRGFDAIPELTVLHW